MSKTDSLLTRNHRPISSSTWVASSGFGGEALTDFYARSVAAATVLAARHPGQAIALVAHGGVLDCLYRAALRLELAAPRTWQMDNASINRLLYVGQGFSVVGWNDSTHLGMARGGPS